MARYKQIDTSPRFLAVDLEAQLLPGTFEHALSVLRRNRRLWLAFRCALRRRRPQRAGAAVPLPRDLPRGPRHGSDRPLQSGNLRAAAVGSGSGPANQSAELVA